MNEKYYYYYFLIFHWIFLIYVWIHYSDRWWVKYTKNKIIFVNFSAIDQWITILQFVDRNPQVDYNFLVNLVITIIFICNYLYKKFYNNENFQRLFILI